MTNVCFYFQVHQPFRLKKYSLFDIGNNTNYFDDETLKQASEFRFANYKRDLSYIDCVGYILAKKRGVKFLTGDEQFKAFENVEFVK